MTGGRPPRGAGRDPWRGGRGLPDSPPEPETGDRAPAPRRAELEELGVAQVERRRAGRVGIGTALAAVAVVGLLAGGFGLLGGRQDLPPDPRPGGSGVAVAGSDGPTPTAPTRSPEVTPFTECGPDPTEPPVMLLQSNGVPTQGVVEVASGPELPATREPGSPFLPVKGPRLSVRPDVVTELWIEGGPCALEWSIELIDPVSEGSWILDEAHNPAADANLFAQNRFDVSMGLAEHRGIGRDLQFGGVFVFRTMVVRAFWSLRIEPLDRPFAALASGAANDVHTLVEGCDISMTLGSGWTERAWPDCETDLSGPLEDAGPEVVVGDPVNLVFGGWQTTALNVICGRLSGLSFVAEPEPGCFLELPGGDPFPAPDVPGRWAVAFAACASENRSNAANNVCGTWYANLEIVSER